MRMAAQGDSESGVGLGSAPPRTARTRVASKEGVRGGTMGSPTLRPWPASPYHRCMATTLPRNSDVADQFDLLADLLEIEGAQSFRVIAYRRAATLMRETPTSIAQLALDGKAKSLNGIGKTIEEKIVQIVDEGEIQALRERKERIPESLIRFMRLPGLGPKTARRIWQDLGITT